MASPNLNLPVMTYECGTVNESIKRLSQLQLSTGSTQIRLDQKVEKSMVYMSLCRSLVTRLSPGSCFSYCNKKSINPHWDVCRVHACVSQSRASRQTAEVKTERHVSFKGHFGSFTVLFWRICSLCPRCFTHVLR